VGPKFNVSAGLQRLRFGGARIAEATVAAVVAWLFAVHVLDHPQPFFAPTAALITIGVTRGQRFQRAVEIVVGVAVGILVADLVARAIGPGTVWSIAVVTALTLIAVVFLGGGPVAVVQAGVSAIYVAVVAAPSGDLLPTRFTDALVGGVVALITNHLPLDPDPLAGLMKDARPVVQELVTVLDKTARALERDDREAAEEALEHARRTDSAIAALHASVAEGLETARLDPLRRRRIGPLQAYEQADREIDLAMRNVRVVARAAAVLTRTGYQAPASIVHALDRMAEAVRSLGEYLHAVGSGSDVEPAARAVQEQALSAVRLAGTALTEGQSWPAVMIVGSVRAMAVDLMRGLGVDRAEVLRLTDEALGIPSGED
jgi:uncharacterized membrane protein YgaE (UPF0421/DUF939 family)